MPPRTKKTILPVDDVISTDLKAKENVNIEVGYAYDDLWSLKLSKKPQNESNYTIALFIERQSRQHRVLAITKLKFTDLHSNESSAVKFGRMFRKAEKMKGYSQIKKDIYRMFSHSERIRITGEICFILISKSEPKRQLFQAQTLPKTSTTLSTDLKKMCYNNIVSDVILRCGSEVFTAHKIILATRCRVFDEILKNNVSEEVKIDIEDLAPHVLKAVLLFIYSGKTDPLTFQSACDLLSAADKYHLYELKTLCVNHIRSSFTIKNVLGYFREHEMAKMFAVEFIAENISEIERTKQWRNFEREFPDLVSAVRQNSIEHWKDMKQKCLSTGELHRCDQDLNITEMIAVKQECPDTGISHWCDQAPKVFEMVAIKQECPDS